MKDLNKMELHERQPLEDGESVIAVPGGWIYKFTSKAGPIAATFVPEPRPKPGRPSKSDDQRAEEQDQ